jgi:hypothetical protein
MAGKQKSVRWEPWIERAIWAVAQKNSQNFSWTANYLMETKLNDMQYFRKDFEPGIKEPDRVQTHSDFEDALYNPSDVTEISDSQKQKTG